jgi:hypothetical protein
VTARLSAPRKRERTWNAAQIADQEHQVWTLRIEGKTQREICDAVGIGPSVVERRWRSYAEAHPVENVPEMRAQIGAQYAWMYARLVPGIANGDTSSAETALKILKALREMNGIDAPVQLDVEVSHRVMPEDIPLRKMLTAVRGKNHQLAEYGPGYTDSNQE